MPTAKRAWARGDIADHLGNLCMILRPVTKRGLDLRVEMIETGEKRDVWVHTLFRPTAVQLRRARSRTQKLSEQAKFWVRHLDLEMKRRVKKT